MSELNFDYDHLINITKAINAHADVRPYDEWVLSVGIASILASLVVAYFAYQLNKKQIEIAKKQSDISAEQTEIAKKQADIMEQQNKIALFDKRYKLFKKIEQLDINFRVMLTGACFDTHISFCNAEEARCFFCKHAFRRLLSFAPKFIDGDMESMSPHRMYDTVESFIVELEKAVFIFVITEEQQQKYQATLATLLRIVHQMTGGSFMGIVEKKEIIYKVSYKDLEPLKELNPFVDIFKNQLYLIPQKIECSKNTLDITS